MLFARTDYIKYLMLSVDLHNYLLMQYNNMIIYNKIKSKLLTLEIDSPIKEESLRSINDVRYIVE